MKQIIENIKKVEEISIKDITRIVEALRGSHGVDFSNYALSSFRRRLSRYLEINKIRDLNMFIDEVRTNRTYADNLVEEITVNVTEMFRDPTFWITLREKILPAIKNRSSLNIWNAACSTGEEVYSMTILLKEAGLLKKSAILATDINSRVLEVAKNGVYKLKSQEINSRNYLQFSGSGSLADYYEVKGSDVHYDKSLIENVEFRRHDLASDDHVPGFDLILCRNVLIYFNSELQDKVIYKFSRSLRGDSFLAIGSKESLMWCKSAGYFKEESVDEKIYRIVAESKQMYQVTI